MTNDLTEKYLEIARKLANDAHCRYCDYRSDPRTKCDTDIADTADAIVKEMVKVREEALEEAIEAAMDHSCRTWAECCDCRGAIAQAIREAKEE